MQTIAKPIIYLFAGGLSTTAVVKIQLIDINDNVPAFSVKDYNVSLKEGRISSSEPIIAVSATDADLNIFYFHANEVASTASIQ